MRFLTGLFICLIFGVGPGLAEKDKKVTTSLPEISMGKPDAPVLIIEYSSLTCTHCAEFHKTVMPIIKKKYIQPGYVRLVLRDFPGDRIALTAHQTAWCKGKEKYLGFVKLFYDTQDKWLLAKDPVKALQDVALENGITKQQFEDCVKSSALMDKIIQSRLKGQKKYKITATPTLVIDATSKEPKVFQEALTLKEIEDVLQPLLKPYLEQEKGCEKSSEKKDDSQKKDTGKKAEVKKEAKEKTTDKKEKPKKAKKADD